MLHASNGASHSAQPWRRLVRHRRNSEAKQTGRLTAPRSSRCSACLGGSSRVVHLELDRMRGVLEADHFLHLELDVAVDEVVVEHAADLEELAVLVELLQRLAERAAHGRDLLELRLGEV